jgi:hypothetical protein
MRWTSPRSLGKTVEAKAANRPVKIAYLVPFDDSPQTQMNLDAVFFESYTRWAGMYTLVIPCRNRRFLDDRYADWLERYDADFIYSYVDLEASLVERIDRLCCPIALLMHQIRDVQDRELTWQAFLPRLDHYIRPVSSISSIQSPASYSQLPHQERPAEPMVFTQYGMDPRDRFLADNFGTGFHLYNVTHAIPGFFRTLCLVPEGLSARMIAGTERCTSRLEAFSAITDRKAVSIAHLAMVNSAGIPRPESMEWAYAFRLFIGTTPLDRIHFWNSRHLGSSWANSTNALIIEPAFFDDDQLVLQLGQYLNKNNFLGQGGGQYQAELHSSSVTPDGLNAIREKLQPRTWNSIHVNRTFNAPAIPTKKDLAERIQNPIADTTTLKLTEDYSEITASEPLHFSYIPPQLRSLAQGQWIVQLSIQRHNNLSRFSNVVDTWDLPRRNKVTRAFTQRLAKPTLEGRLALVPSVADMPSRNQTIKNTASYDISLPSDEDFFRYLTLEFPFPRLPADDLRLAVPRTGYIDLAVSDKGQNLRGVISLLEDLPSAFGILTNKFWRRVFTEANDDSSKPLTFSLDKLMSFIPDNRETIQRLTTELRFENLGETKKYLRDSLKDTLEHLVRSNVFFQVTHWRCKYCGHVNSRSFDNMKLKNECNICATEYLASLEIEWGYELSDFVYRSLEKHTGLPVLWALGTLQDRMTRGAFWYLPEVDLYESDEDLSKRNEIDILCMVDGEFNAVEVKRSASMFLNKDGAQDKFVNVVGLLRPDIALLAFEQYCSEGEDANAIRARLTEAASQIRERIGPWTKLKVLVAQDDPSFNEFPADLGWHGSRVSKYYR